MKPPLKKHCSGIVPRCNAGRKKLRFYSLFFSVSALVAFLTCSRQLELTGTGSQAGNGIVIGTAYRADGSFASMAIVTLRRQNYLADTSQKVPLSKIAILAKRTMTDAQGRFSIDSLDNGNYCIEINDEKALASVLKFNIALDSNVIDLPRTTLTPYAQLNGYIDKSLVGTSPSYLQVYGLERLVALDSSGGFSINDLPAGMYDFRIIAAHAAFSSIAVDSVWAVSGATTTLPFFGWRFSKRVFINTTASGAATTGSVFNFPVLVRLKSPDFDFSQAQSNGSDIRFTKQDDTPLSYQIERFDAAAKVAEIWVKVDTVRGNDSVQFITMRWGASVNSTFSAPSGIPMSTMSNSAAVFDTSYGFMAVWHLGEAANTQSGGYRDASSAGLNATAAAPNQASDTEAVAGKGKRFIPQSGQLSAPLPAGIVGNRSFSVMFWLNFHPDTNRIGILIIGQPQTLKGFHFLVKPDTTTQFGLWGDTAMQNKFSFAPYVDQWTHIATVYDSSAQTLKTYINGKLVIVNAATGFNVQPGQGILMGNGVIASNTANVTTNLNGALDEVRIYGKVLTEDEIRLNYATQKK